MQKESKAAYVDKWFDITESSDFSEGGKWPNAQYDKIKPEHFKKAAERIHKVLGISKNAAEVFAKNSELGKHMAAWHTLPLLDRVLFSNFYPDEIQDAYDKHQKHFQQTGTNEEVLSEDNWIHVDQSKKGMFKGVGVSEIEKEINALKKKHETKAATESEKTRMHELEFALRAKKNHGFQNEDVIETPESLRMKKYVEFMKIPQEFMFEEISSKMIKNEMKKSAKLNDERSGYTKLIAAFKKDFPDGIDCPNPKCKDNKNNKNCSMCKGTGILKSSYFDIK